MVVPPKHPKMIIFTRKTLGCWVPPFSETSIYIYIYLFYDFDKSKTLKAGAVIPKQSVCIRIKGFDFPMACSFIIFVCLERLNLHALPPAKLVEN